LLKNSLIKNAFPLTSTLTLTLTLILSLPLTLTLKHINTFGLTKRCLFLSKYTDTLNKILNLGQIIVMSPDKEIEIQRRIALAWQAFGRANLIYSSRLPLFLKIKVFDQCILPTLTCGAETWNLTKKHVIRRRTTQRSHERKILCITWKDRKTAKWIRK